MDTRNLVFPALFLISLATAAPGLGQISTGSISGYVLDPAGRPIPNAAVAASDDARRQVRTVSADRAGFYVLAALGPATYSVSASAGSFQQQTVRDIVVAVNSARRVDFRLPLEGRKEAVEVAATVQPVPGQSSELGMVLERSRIASLPLNRRDFLQLALLTPGVLPPVEDSELASRGSFAMHANGGREDFNNFLLDGVDNNDSDVNRFVLQPSVDAVQEFQIATNSFSAEFGRSAAGQVNVVTRSGESRLHGALYEYLRNSRLDARNYFAASTPPVSLRNQYGANLGGPVQPGTLFFFASVDFLRERRGLSRLATVPGMEARAGNLASIKSPVMDPFTRAPFPGNVIPSSRISPVARRVLDLFPQPSQTAASGNYLAQPVHREENSQGIARLDHHISRRDLVTYRYGYGLLDLYEPYTEETGSVPGFGDYVRDPGHNAMVHHQRTISPRTIQSLRLGFNRFTRRILPESRGTDAASFLGVGWLPANSRDFGFPTMNVAGFSRVGDATTIPIYRSANTYQILESVSLVRGNHFLKAGTDIRHERLANSLYMLTRGSLSFSGALSGAGIGDLLLGLPSFGLQSQSDNPQTLRSTAWNIYLQDDWKLAPQLTLNLGLRYELNTPPFDPTDRMSALDPRTGKVVRVGTEGLSRSGIQPDRNNVAPRVGLAWSPTSNLVVRAGYGLYFDSGMLIVNSAQYFNPPQFNLRVFFPSAQSLLTLANPFPTQGGMVPPPALNTLSPDLTTAGLQHWNFNVQRSLGAVGVVSLAYAGSKGTHLIRSRDLNQPRPGPGDVQARRPYARFGNILYIESAANSVYHSLQASFNRRMSRNVSLWAVYTLGKSIDDSSAFLPTRGDRNFPQDSSNTRAERALSSFDTPHRLVLAPILALPSGNRWTRHTELRGIITASSGQTATPLLRFDNSNTGNTGGNFGSDRPDLIGDLHLYEPGPNLWFNTAAFRVPGRYSFGSAGRNILRGPGFASVDLSLARRFPLSERAALSLDVQAFNLLNRVNFDMPELFADEPASFGRIFSARPARQIQFALRLHF